MAGLGSVESRWGRWRPSVLSQYSKGMSEKPSVHCARPAGLVEAAAAGSSWARIDSRLPPDRPNANQPWPRARHCATSCASDGPSSCGLEKTK